MADVKHFNSFDFSSFPSSRHNLKMERLRKRVESLPERYESCQQCGNKVLGIHKPGLSHSREQIMVFFHCSCGASWHFDIDRRAWTRRSETLKNSAGFRAYHSKGMPPVKGFKNR